MKQQRIFFTGGTSGLGRAAVIDLVSAGHHVFLAARDEVKAKTMLEKVEALAGKLSIIPCDLDDLSQLKASIDRFVTEHESLDALVNNAGLWNRSFELSKDGIERTLQVNLIAPLLLMENLIPLLKRSSNGKIINTASGLHQGDLQLDDLQYRKNFSGFKAYRQSKLGLIMLTRLFAASYNDLGIYSFHPGVVSTSLGRNLGGLGNAFFKLIGIRPEQGAETLLFLLRTEKEALKSGAYYTKRKVKDTTAVSYDLALAEQLKTALQQWFH